MLANIPRVVSAHPAFLAAAAQVVQRRGFVRVVDAFERGVTLTLGKLTGVKEPGLRMCLPLVQQMIKVDTRIQSLDIRRQNLMTADNVSVHVDAVAFLRVADAQRAVCEVDRPVQVAEELAQAHLRDELSHSTLEEILHRRGEFSDRIRSRVAEKAAPLGLEILDVKLKNISVDDSMVRALAKKAEAERERQARVIHADAEVTSARKLMEAGELLSASPAGMRLRELQTYAEMARENGSTIVVPATFGAALGSALGRTTSA